MKFIMKIMQSRFFLTLSSPTACSQHHPSLHRWPRSCCGVYRRVKNKVLDKFNDADV